MENQITIINPKEFGLEENKATEITSGLKTILEERELLKNAYLDVIDLELTVENLPTFKQLRLEIRNNRTKGIEVWHKTNKEFFLTGGRFVDAIKNKEVAENERMENKLMDAEKYFENLEKERLKAIHNLRVEKLLPFNYEIGNVDFSGMDENMFNAILTGAEKQHTDKLEAEKQAELQRLEVLRLEAEEKEKQRLELIELKKQNEIKEKQIELERIEAAKLAAIEKAKADAELKEANRLAKIESDKQVAILLEQQKANAKLQNELKAKADAEKLAAETLAAEQKAKALAEKKAAKAPDKQKLKVWVDSFVFQHSMVLESIEANEVGKLIIDKRNAFIKWANEQINTL